MFQTQRKKYFDISILNKLSEDLTNATTNSKFAYHRRIACELNDPSSALKTCWFILKIPLIPPIPVNDQLATKFLEKANLFHEFITQQCNAIERGTGQFPREQLPPDNYPPTNSPQDNSHRTIAPHASYPQTITP